jgi:hypothetical protein
MNLHQSAPGPHIRADPKQTIEQETLALVCENSLRKIKLSKKYTSLPDERFAELGQAANLLVRQNIDIRALHNDPFADQPAAEIIRHLCRSTVSASLLSRTIWQAANVEKSRHDMTRRKILIGLFLDTPGFDMQAALEGSGQSEAFLTDNHHELMILKDLCIATGEPWAHLRDCVENLPSCIGIFQNFEQSVLEAFEHYPTAVVDDPFLETITHDQNLVPKDFSI